MIFIVRQRTAALTFMMSTWKVTGTFGDPGEPALDISYSVQVRADAPDAIVNDLIRATDAITDIKKTLRGGCAVRLM
jgi:hypothetical protein